MALNTRLPSQQKNSTYPSTPHLTSALERLRNRLSSAPPSFEQIVDRPWLGSMVLFYSFFLALATFSNNDRATDLYDSKGLHLNRERITGIRDAKEMAMGGLDSKKSLRAAICYPAHPDRIGNASFDTSYLILLPDS
ncbi:unnamed protein product [Cochlearia groenlandica]